MIVIIWILFAFLCALAGNNKQIGYGGSLLLCLLLSPVLGLIITLCLPDKLEQVTQKTYRCTHCKLDTTLNSHYCPRCAKDGEGFTLSENQERFAEKK